MTRVPALTVSPCSDRAQGCLRILTCSAVRGLGSRLGCYTGHALERYFLRVRGNGGIYGK